MANESQQLQLWDIEVNQGVHQSEREHKKIQANAES
jgi:hypothetical protein